MAFSYYKIYKPYGTLSQFTKEKDYHRTLTDLYEFPADVYPIGRLDKDSEGLLLLTNDKSIFGKILDPENKVLKNYYVQVEGNPSAQDLKKLNTGVRIKIKPGKYHQTLPANAQLIKDPGLPERIPPIRYRKNIPTTWISIKIIEGKNRQVRKMCASIGFPVLRLVRFSIGPINISGMQTGEVLSVDLKKFWS